MRLPFLPVLIVLVFNGLVDLYIIRAIRTRCLPAVKKWASPLAVVSSLVLALLFILVICMPKRTGDNEALLGLMWCLFAYMSVYIPKYVFIIIDFLANLPRIFHRKRIKSLSRAGLALALFSFCWMWWSAMVTPRQLDVRQVEVEIPDLPESFDGYRIVQISDLHTGTYGNDTSIVSNLVDRINSLDADLIVFTGDIVNRKSTELIPFTRTFSRLRGKEGSPLSILGNHDYGDYYNWPDSAAWRDNISLLKQLQKNMGWRMLNNDSYVLRRSQSDSIVMIGVENVGDAPFRTYGDLDAAYHGDLNDDAVKILLSHNPAHWVNDIAQSPDKNIALTLSGHTHAMQTRVFGFSPAMFRYPTWGGLYKDEDKAHQLYVNIGIGEVGFPARLGATPEITVLTLHRSRK